MVRRSPAEYYLKYLISHPDRYQDEVIAQMCADKGLDYLGPDYLDRLKARTIPPCPFHPYDTTHFSSQHFLNKHRIRSLYFKDDATRDALRILEVPKLKEFSEAMILVGAPNEVIARGTRKVCPAVPISAPGLERFRHFFWNVDLLDFTEIRALLEKRGDSVDPCYKKAFKKDSRRIAAELPFSPLTALMAQLRMGITPVGVNFAELMERVRVISGIRTYQYVLEDSSFAAENAKNFISVAQAATDLLERAAKPEELLLEKFNSLRLLTDAAPIPQINELSGGRHTTDLQVIEMEEEAVETEDEN